MKKLLCIIFFIASCSNKAQNIQPVLNPTEQMLIRHVDTIFYPVQLHYTYEKIRNYSFETEGIIDSLFIEEGSPIRTGEKIGKLRTSELRYQIQSQQELLSEKNKDLKRTNLLFNQQAQTAIQKEDAERAARAEQSKLQLLQSKLSSQEIKSTSTGTVISTYYRSGEFCKLGEILTSIGEGKKLLAGTIPAWLLPNSPNRVSIKLYNKNSYTQQATITTEGNNYTVSTPVPEQGQSELIALLPITGNLAIITNSPQLAAGEVIQIQQKNSKPHTAIVVRTSENSTWIRSLDGIIPSGTIDEIIH